MCHTCCMKVSIVKCINNRRTKSLAGTHSTYTQCLPLAAAATLPARPSPPPPSAATAVDSILDADCDSELCILLLLHFDTNVHISHMEKTDSEAIPHII